MGTYIYRGKRTRVYKITLRVPLITYDGLIVILNYECSREPVVYRCSRPCRYLDRHLYFPYSRSRPTLLNTNLCLKSTRCSYRTATAVAQKGRLLLSSISVWSIIVYECQNLYYVDRRLYFIFIYLSLNHTHGD